MSFGWVNWAFILKPHSCQLRIVSLFIHYNTNLEKKRANKLTHWDKVRFYSASHLSHWLRPSHLNLIAPRLFGIFGGAECRRRGKRNETRPWTRRLAVHQICRGRQTNRKPLHHGAAAMAAKNINKINRFSRAGEREPSEEAAGELRFSALIDAIHSAWVLHGS